MEVILDDAVQADSGPREKWEMPAKIRHAACPPAGLVHQGRDIYAVLDGELSFPELSTDLT